LRPYSLLRVSAAAELTLVLRFVHLALHAGVRAVTAAAPLPERSPW
jgi:hypothetical protein